MGFSFPKGLFSLGFLALLIWLYLRERHRRELEVPSLLLWQAVREEAERSRFRPNLLFVMQAALLAALALGMARPYSVRRSAAAATERAVLVFDTSASMQALEHGERRFDQARRKARELISSLASGEEVMVIAVDAQPRILLAFTRDRLAVGRAVETLEPGDGPSRLALGIQLARSVRGPGAGTLDIAVFTDLPRAELTVPLAGGERLRYFRFGHTDDNVAIAALRVTQSPFQDAGEARAYALVKNYSHTEKDAELHVALSGREVLRERLRLGPREGRAVPIRSLAQPGRLEARLEVADALSVDNRALAYVRPIRRIRLVAVTASAELASDLRTLAGAIAAIDLREVAPAKLGGEDLRAADVVVFHGVVPDGPLPANSLFLYPPADNPLFPVTHEVVDAQILDWNERDSILRDLRYVEALPLRRARMIRLPPWAHTLIASRAGAEEFPLAFAGELGGRRVICFAFDLAGRSVRKSENLSLLLLVLNSLKWLAPPDSSSPAQVDVGERYRESLATPASVTITDSEGNSETRPAAREISLELARAGEYRIAFDGQQRSVYANLFDPEESDIGREGPGEEEIAEEGSAVTDLTSARWLREFGGWLYWLAVALLIGEWTYGFAKE